MKTTPCLDLESEGPRAQGWAIRLAAYRPHLGAFDLTILMSNYDDFGDFGYFDDDDDFEDNDNFGDYHDFDDDDD